MNLAVTLSLYAGGPGSGCKGPNCGRPHGAGIRNPSALLHTTVLVTPDGKAYSRETLRESQWMDHEDLAHALGYKTKFNVGDVPRFLREGGIRIANLGDMSALEFGNPKAVERVLSALPQLANDKLRVDYRDMGKQGSPYKSWMGPVGKVEIDIKRYFGLIS